MQDKLTEDERNTLRKLRAEYPMREDECYPPGPDRVDQPKNFYDKDKTVRIDFYAHGKFVDTGMIKKGSGQKDRETAAKKLGIEFFDRFTLDGIRVVAEQVPYTGFFDEYGRLWIVENNS